MHAGIHNVCSLVKNEKFVRCSSWIHAMKNTWMHKVEAAINISYLQFWDNFHVTTIRIWLLWCQTHERQEVRWKTRGNNDGKLKKKWLDKNKMQKIFNTSLLCFWSLGSQVQTFRLWQFVTFLCGPNKQVWSTSRGQMVQRSCRTHALDCGFDVL